MARGQKIKKIQFAHVSSARDAGTRYDAIFKLLSAACVENWNYSRTNPISRCQHMRYYRRKDCTCCPGVPFLSKSRRGDKKCAWKTEKHELEA